MYEMWKKHKEIISVSVLIQLVLTLILAVVAWQLIRAHQGTIFDEFADDYITQQRQPVNMSTTTSGTPVGQESQVVDVVQQANPAVVSIVISREVPVFERRYRQFGPFQVPEVYQEGTQRQEVGEGSGFIVSESGLVVTNRHVVSRQDASYTVITSDGETFDAAVVARDSQMDIAVMRITEGDNFPHLSFGNSDNLKLGQSVIAIGNALAEFRNTVSVGIVSGLSRSIVAGSVSRSEQLDGVIQTDAAINPGNSGGPLLNLRGEVIGVNVAVAQRSENVGFALPSKAVDEVVNSVEKHGEIRRPYLGVRYVQVTPEVAKRNNLSVEHGALVTRGQRRSDLAVLPDSPAKRAGIESSDIILSVDGQSLQDTDLADIIRQKEIGETVDITLLRDGEKMTVQATLETAPSQ
jgi:serine protease Do